MACQGNEPLQEPNNKFSDEILRNIEDLQDRRDVEQLMPFLNDENATYRAAAVEAMASIQDSTTIEPLTNALKDSSVEVRKLAAYALGQCYHQQAEESLLYGLHIEDTLAVRKVMLEALGKCVTEKNLNYFATYHADDSLELEGLAWGMYRAGIRGMASDSLVALASGFLHPDYTYQTRLGAAHFLSRTRNIDITDQLDSIITSALYDKSPFIRMASASALRNSSSKKSTYALTEKIINDTDYRVRLTAMRAMSSLDLSVISAQLFMALDDENINVGITAAGLIINKADKSIESQITESIKNATNWRVRALLYQALLKIDPKSELVIGQVKSAYDSSANVYEKGNLLTSLSESVISYEFIVNQTFGAEHMVIATNGIGALASIRGSEDFPDELNSAFADIFKEAIATGDLAMIGTATGVISNPDLEFKQHYDTIDFLHEAKAKLTLPKDNEGMQALQAAIDFFEGNETATPVQNDYNHPIDWELVVSIKAKQKMKITTDKGEIVLEMLVEDAPGSAANFIDLASQGYYNNKNFHRVVPNFVAQGGCNRGDGWGGEAYSIRSEFAPLNYGEGYVGMASAGKDTEGTQWFITHSPTPHLDGRYSIFARVYKGMDVVHQLEVGDKIVSISLL